MLDRAAVLCKEIETNLNGWDGAKPTTFAVDLPVCALIRTWWIMFARARDKRLPGTVFFLLIPDLVSRFLPSSHGDVIA